MIKKHTWYKVYHTERLYDGNDYIVFEFAMNEQVQQYEEKYKNEGTYVKTVEWKIKKTNRAGRNSGTLMRPQTVSSPETQREDRRIKK